MKLGKLKKDMEILDFGDRKFQYVDVTDLELTRILDPMLEAAGMDVYEKYVDSIQRLPGAIFRIYVA